MTGVALTFNDDNLGPTLRRLLDRSRDLTPAFDLIGGRLQTATQRRFETETDPDGRKWPALSLATRKAKKHNRILSRSGGLCGLLSYAPSRLGVTVGSNKDYAAIHQMGGKAGRGRKVTIPARPYLGVNDDDHAMITETLLEHLSR